ncbi:unnamed protein product [Psylliodes chrysocephalus]|uniref:Uncharacterized protein n=1 Tax=Psylliodes chrysocephalus TaxID=3402493 RepID=A0A9P0D063_9CUCU|nr:unnamed protein product [Psylliodes chrysocephala]
MKLGKGTSQKTFCFPRYFSYAVRQILLFLHVISAFYRQDTVSVFHHDSKVLISAGQLFLAALYSPNADETSLDKIRYDIVLNFLTKPTFNLASLPPKNAADSQHILQVYLQIQGLYDRSKDPLSLDWRRTDLGLLSIINTKDPAPAEILNTLSCKCMKKCTGKWSCRKVGMKCSTICLNCKGYSFKLSILRD